MATMPAANGAFVGAQTIFKLLGGFSKYNANLGFFHERIHVIFVGIVGHVI